MLMLVLGVAWLAAPPCRAGAEGGAAGAGAGPPGPGPGAPEVVLQLKYDGGELDRILLTQFRAPAAAAAPATQAARSDVCADLCFAGLGGSACGRSCAKLLPVGLQQALAADNSSAAPLGAPRTAVCPVLCHNNLGEPLCSCGEAEAGVVDWAAVCAVFCDTDHYELGGCGPCAGAARGAGGGAQLLQARVLSTAEGWQSWCSVQCRQGQGGAACNCDRAPFQ